MMEDIQALTRHNTRSWPPNREVQEFDRPSSSYRKIGKRAKQSIQEPAILQPLRICKELGGRSKKR